MATQKASVGMYSGYDTLSLQTLFVYFLALPSLLHSSWSILFNCFLYLSYTDWCVHSNATALTVDNITITLNGIDWLTICASILRLPDSKYDEKIEQFSNEDDSVRATVREWLLRDPLASWRRLIDQLYSYGAVVRADSMHASLHWGADWYVHDNDYDSCYTTPHDAWKMHKGESHWSIISIQISAQKFIGMHVNI